MRAGTKKETERQGKYKVEEELQREMKGSWLDERKSNERKRDSCGSV